MLSDRQTIETLPILYSFRRCPYAMRARMAIAYSGIDVELREVVLSNKPKSMLEYSPKGTVPVLVLPDEVVIDESRDIIRWALSMHDPDQWVRDDHEWMTAAKELVDENDTSFKQALDRYKYHVRYPEHSAEFYREKGEVFLERLNNKLSESEYLLGDDMSVADISIFPFVRQFAFVDKEWFDQAPYAKLQTWLNGMLQSSLFMDVMQKHAEWKDGE